MGEWDSRTNWAKDWRPGGLVLRTPIFASALPLTPPFIRSQLNPAPEERPTVERLEPYEDLLRLLFKDTSPQEAAKCLKPIIEHVWEQPVSLPDSAPEPLQRFRDQAAWRRFEASDPATRQLVCVHLLYRAAASLGVEDCEASLVLMGLAKQGLRDVLLIWLGGRDCAHCVELRERLMGMEARKS